MVNIQNAHGIIPPRASGWAGLAGWDEPVSNGEYSERPRDHSTPGWRLGPGLAGGGSPLQKVKALRTKLDWELQQWSQPEKIPFGTILFGLNRIQLDEIKLIDLIASSQLCLDQKNLRFRIGQSSFKTD